MLPLSKNCYLIISLKLIYDTWFVPGFMLDSQNTGKGNMHPFHGGTQDQLEVLNA